MNETPLYTTFSSLTNDPLFGSSSLTNEGVIEQFFDLKWDSYSNYVVATFLVLAAAGVKLCYHVTPALYENIPESWCVDIFNDEILKI